MADPPDTGNGCVGGVSLESLQRLVSGQAKELERLRKDHNALRATVDALQAHSEVLRQCLSRRGLLTPREFGRALEAAGAPPEPTAGKADSTAALELKDNTTFKGGAGAATRAPLKFEPDLHSCALTGGQGAWASSSNPGASARSRASSEPTGHKDGLARCDLYKIAQYLLQSSTGPKARARALQTVDFALKRGVSPHSWQGPGTPLKGAVQGRCADLVALLLQARASPNESDEKNVSVLHLAVYDGQEDICKVLLEARANVNHADCYTQTPLFFAPSRQVCEVLFRNHADMNLTNHKGQSALHMAGRAGLGDVLMWMSGRVSRAMITLKDRDGTVAADFARHAGVRLEVLEKLEQNSCGSSYVGSHKPSPMRGAAPPLMPGADPAWETVSPPPAPGTSSGGPEMHGLSRGNGNGSVASMPSFSSPNPQLQHTPLSPGTEASGSRRAVSSSADYRFTSVAGGAPGNLDQRKSFRDALAMWTSASRSAMKSNSIKLGTKQSPQDGS